MKRYLLFAGSWYYPGGGMEDFIGSDDDIDNLKTKIPNPASIYHWWQIYDTKHDEMVEQSKND